MFSSVGQYQVRLGQHHFVKVRDEPVLETVRREWDRAFPRLQAIRDSIAHADERLHGEAYSQPLVPEPWNESDRAAEPGSIPLVSVEEGAPAPQVFQYPSVSGSRFAATLRDGTYGEIAIVEKTVRQARDAVQLLIDHIGWEGEAHVFSPTAPPGETPRNYFGLTFIEKPTDPGQD
jgi:hypothetical protein